MAKTKEEKAKAAAAQSARRHKLAAEKKLTAPKVPVLSDHAPSARGNPKYDREIQGKYGTGSCIIDVYSVIDAYAMTNPQLQHAVKKAVLTGGRGHKDERQDLVDIRDSAQSALDMFDDKLNK